jgi:hypothetical protein
MNCGTRATQVTTETSGGDLRQRKSDPHIAQAAAADEVEKKAAIDIEMTPSA